MFSRWTLMMLLGVFVTGCESLNNLIAGPEPAPFVSDFCLAVPEPCMKQSTAEVIIDDPTFSKWFLLVDGYGIEQCNWTKLGENNPKCEAVE